MTFEILYTEFYEAIYRFVFRMIGNTESAEDITQETFIKLYKNINPHNTIRNPKAWLYQVAGNLCRDKIKRNNAYRKIIDNIFLKEDTKSNTESNFIESIESDFIRKALKRLSYRDQMLLQLYQDGLSYNDIAEVMDIKRSSVGRMLSRSIEKAEKLFCEKK
jgi:RNA polymerase sigma-70 factor (ECF subfamily)